MQTGILHTHTLVVSIFLILYVIKTALLLSGKVTLLDKIREKTKVVDIVLGTLILGTGGYLMFILGGIEPYLWVKVAAILALIPIGIIGMKRHNKVLATLGLVGFIYFYGVSETHSLTMKRVNYIELATAGADPTLYSGEVIYANECVRCHGTDGAAQAYKSYNLQNSKLNAQQAVAVVLNGRNTMKGYIKRMNAAQALAVSEYAQTLKK